MINPLLIPLIENGIDRNIVVYDDQAKNKFSNRLKSLMRVCAQQSGLGFLEVFILEEQIPGITLLYKHKGCTLPEGKREIVLGIAEKGIILGAY